MELARRTRWIALSLPVALAAAAVLARPAPPGVLASGPLGGRACAESAAQTAAVPATVRLDPVLDAGGTLVAQRLVVTVGTLPLTETLPPESFVSAPAGDRVLVGDDDGTRSRLRLLDTVRGCWTALGAEADVVRGGVVAANGTLVYEHRVERASRRDLGVWQVAVGGRRPAVKVLPGLAADPAYGPTFATDLLVAADGRLVVSTCGLSACRVRVLDQRSGAIAQVDGTGPAVRLKGGDLVVQHVCEDLPCPLDAVNLATGARVATGEVLP